MLLSNRAFRLFDDIFNDSFFARPFDVVPSSVMKTDVQEKDGNYLVDIELPGFNKEDIQAELKDGYLTIKAGREENKDEKDKNDNFIRRERYCGTCNRSFYVGEGMKQEDIKAGFQNGVLQLVIPKDGVKAVEEKAKLIDIK